MNRKNKDGVAACFKAPFIAIFFLAISFSASTLRGDEIVFVQDNVEHKLAGEIVITAEDNGCLFRDVNCRLWLVKAEEIKSKVDVEEVAKPLSPKEVAANVLAELPEGFRTETTKHFVIAYNTERGFAKYIGGLYERLLRGFTEHWKSKRKWKLSEPRDQLVAIIFKNFTEYSEFVKKDIGIEPPTTMVAYYNLMTNRVVMYDLTSELAAPGQNRDDDRQITEILSSPNAANMVTTIVHEGTHQLMFNMGMQQRLAATPIWVNEGLAMYFEPPDVSSSGGWRAIGQINQIRMPTFRQLLATKPRDANRLKEMLTSDDIFRDPEQLLERYAEAWAFNYFLLNRHSKEFVEYLKFLSEKKPLLEDDAETRLADFAKFFPMSLEELDKEFIEYIRALK